MHPRQADLLKQASELSFKLATDKTAAPVLWKYVDPEGKEFYLTEKKMTIRSPYSGKTFSAKPERQNMGAVSKELREEATADAGSGPGGKTTTKRRKRAAEDWKA